jgi:hypothetical protein
MPPMDCATSAVGRSISASTRATRSACQSRQATAECLQSRASRYGPAAPGGPSAQQPDAKTGCYLRLRAGRGVWRGIRSQVRSLKVGLKESAGGKNGCHEVR